MGAAPGRGRSLGSRMKIRYCPWIAALVVVAATGCGGGQKKQVVIAPEYHPEYAVVFDDLLAPALFGFDPQGRDPTLDPKLRERALRSDLILPVKVETISRVGGVENKGAYEIVLSATAAPLFGNAPGVPLIINVGAGSPAYPWVEGAGGRWVGTRLILFLKRFRTGKRNQPDVIHYRGEPDTQKMRETVHRHVAARVLPVKSSPGE
jgi:hypothetical protein